MALSWSEFEQARPDLAAAGRELFSYFGVGLAFLATVRPDGGPRLHPVCPVLYEGRLLAFVIPSPKLRDLRRDGRFALHSYPLPDNEDAFYLTGTAVSVGDPDLRAAVAAQYFAERDWQSSPPDFESQALVEFGIDTCLLTRTTGHADFAPRHSVWHAPTADA